MLRTEDLVRTLKKNKYVIYGAGYVADNFYKALENRDLLGKFEGFITTKGSSEAKYGWSVRAIDECNLNDELVCIAVHESITGEIETILKQSGIENYTWIYPNLYELLAGNKICTENVPIKSVLSANKNNLMIAIRYAAIEQFYGERADGYELYLAAMKLHCGIDTANKRLDSFKELIEIVEKKGYKEINPISLLENYELLDGVHRLAIAIYWGENTIDADIYKSLNGGKINIHEANGRADISELSKKLEEGILSPLKEINKRIMEKYGVKC
ncbi:hypothetical protein SAMN04487829_1480 [Pseudobutyrivibrio sp. NOR37]|uniref:ParB/Sulfiredoxin domain-containing protein n=1 Tax=Pseudobutyrivibrio xylanivorans TaxID=185007 RepID=A0A6M0LIR6_PSEXY|nr:MULTISPECIES: hypothetical protein [Pseudobutyrivibrio]NEX01873.1 hypothetical protein [Pseudobutyrivibrio xylanivorans]SFR72428.1 hypothetical protein SAMN04487829_1480 [Pseudobutyrivibrio sp. NOR37]